MFSTDRKHFRDRNYRIFFSISDKSNEKVYSNIGISSQNRTTQHESDTSQHHSAWVGHESAQANMSHK